MSEKLIVKNFGPIKDAEIDIKKVTIFIGEQAGGKSTLAKLVALIKRGDTLIETPEIINSRLEEYGIKSYLKENSYFEYENESFSFTIKPKKEKQQSDFSSKTESKNSYYKDLINSYNKLKIKIAVIIEEKENALRKKDYSLATQLRKEEEKLSKIMSKKYSDITSSFPIPLYYPAERSFFSSIANISFSLMKESIPIPQILIQFGAIFEAAKNGLRDTGFSKFDIDYSFEGDKIRYKSQEYFPLHFSSSGLQSVFPLLMVTKAFKSNLKDSNYTFIVEEPELNLYPNMQKDVVEYLIDKCTEDKNSLVITTHSPYILSTFDNCIQAGNVVKNRPELKEQVEKLIPSEYHLDYDDVAVYYVAKGTVRSIMDEEYKGIDTNAIDDVSEDLGAIFDELLSLKYQK